MGSQVFQLGGRGHDPQLVDVLIARGFLELAEILHHPRDDGCDGLRRLFESVQSLFEQAERLVHGGRQLTDVTVGDGLQDISQSGQRLIDLVFEFGFRLAKRTTRFSG
ncbi:MAG: hypothetical protein LBL92_02080 [Propionibacteriaceae bacterium]|nr:hypothetical protein [Propionibacteriaceae bacterium]